MDSVKLLFVFVVTDPRGIQSLGEYILLFLQKRHQAFQLRQNTRHFTHLSVDISQQSVFFTHFCVTGVIAQSFL